jgi:digeranylgeranylglycerophospholipid reductase
MDWPGPDEVDVLVAGGGPAGALAGFEAASAGCSVLVVEAKAHVGERCHCAEWVPALLGGEIDPEFRRARADELTVSLDRGSGRVKAPGLSLDRPRWEKHLLVRAARAGAVVQAGVRFKGFKGGRVVLDGPFGPAEVGAGVVVAADGALSRSAASAGLERQETVAAVQVEVPLAGDVYGGTVAFRPDLIGYQWLFPKADTANVGLGGLPRGEANLSRMLEEWRSELVARGLIGPSILRLTGGRLPVAGPRERLVLVKDGTTVLLAGDAAGLTHPTTGAGIPQAIASGTLAGRAAARLARGERSAGAEYDGEVRDRFGGYLERGRARREKAGEMWAHDFEKAVKTYWPLWPKKDAWTN